MFNTLGALSLEEHSDGVLHTLSEVLAADKSTPTSLVLACHGDAESGALQFSDTEWTAHIVDAAKLVAAVAEARDRLVLTVFCSCAADRSAGVRCAERRVAAAVGVVWR